MKNNTYKKNLIVQIVILLCTASLFYLFFTTLFSDLVPGQGATPFFNLPFYLSSFSMISLVLTFPLSEAHRVNEKYYKILGSISMGIGAISFLVSLFFLIFMYNGNLFLDGPIVAFPFIALNTSLLLVIFGFLIIGYRAELTIWHKEKEKKASPVVLVKTTIKLLFSFYFFGDFCIGLIAFDFQRNILGQIFVLLLILVPVSEMFHDFLLSGQEPEQKEKKSFRISLFTLCGSCVLFLFVVLYRLYNPYFIVESCQAIFPVTFTASIAVGIFILLLLDIVYPAFLVLKHVLKERKQNP